MLKFIKGKKHLNAPKIINIELTTRCPIQCPQCYKGEFNDFDIDFCKLKSIAEEVSKVGTDTILLSGGEPLMYVHLVDAIGFINSLGIKSALSTSGISICEEKLLLIKNAGLNTIFVSLNGSTEEINSLSREGYGQAVETIKLAYKQNINCRVNWVARHDNINDLPKLIKYIKDLGASGIDILLNKPDNNGNIISALSNDDFEQLVSIVNNDKENYIAYQNCFVTLKNRLNTANKAYLLKGCSAGIYSMAVTARGGFMPCPHMFNEQFNDSVMDYWLNDEKLNQFRENNVTKKDKCSNCLYDETCRPCNVVSESLESCVCFEKL